MVQKMKMKNEDVEVDIDLNVLTRLVQSCLCACLTGEFIFCL